MRVGNAPVSWGIFEVAGLSGSIPYQQVMAEIAAAGYSGTELGPWGYFPTDPTRLRSELQRRGLALASAFCPVDLTDPGEYDQAEAQVFEVANLLQAMGTREVILADPRRASRVPRAGRAGPLDEMSPIAWQATVTGLNRIGRKLASRGMIAVFHHHVATYVETGPEIDRLLAATDPQTVGLCLDTGHATYGGADPVQILRRWSNRVSYVHLKDIDPRALERVRAEGMDYDSAVRCGVFCPLGEGCVDFTSIFVELRRRGYAGWLIVEQDVIVDESTGHTMSPVEAARQSYRFLKTLLTS